MLTYYVFAKRSMRIIRGTGAGALVKVVHEVRDFAELGLVQDSVLEQLRELDFSA